MTAHIMDPGLLVRLPYWPHLDESVPGAGGHQPSFHGQCTHRPVVPHQTTTVHEPGTGKEEGSGV